MYRFTAHRPGRVGRRSSVDPGSGGARRRRGTQSPSKQRCRACGLLYVASPDCQGAPEGALLSRALFFSARRRGKGISAMSCSASSLAASPCDNWRATRFVPMGLRRSRGVVSTSRRLDARHPLASIDDFLSTEPPKPDRDNPRESWERLMVTLGAELLARWRSMPNHANAGDTGAESLLLKLYNVGEIERREFRLLRAAIVPKSKIKAGDCEALASIIEVFSRSSSAERGAPCQA